MNKSELKSFATYARRELLEKVALRAKGFGMDKKSNISIVTNGEQLIVNGKQYPSTMRNAFESLKRQYESKGYEQLIEEAAYTWFNRIIAIRYMEVHDYLPERVNILSSSTGKVEPDILLHYQSMELAVDKVHIRDIIDHGNYEEAYRKLFIAQCNALQPVLPFLFEKIDDYTELLLPDFLLDSESIINKLVQNDELTSSFAEVEVIGWLYQYYNIEPKAMVDKKVKNGERVDKFEIPAKTQLFTPQWIVRYMVENSLGSKWLNAYPESILKKQMKYYIEPVSQTEEVQMRLDAIRQTNLEPEKIRIIDPACGSGHILVYAFEILFSIYEERGYVSNEIPTLILENNLYGLDIDDRAAQLSAFSLLMKAREKSRRIFRNPPTINVYSIQESNELSVDDLVRLLSVNETESRELKILINFYKDAKNYGSILVPEKIDSDKYLKRIEKIYDEGIRSLFDVEAICQLPKFESLLRQTKLLVEKYDVVITNPPYMGAGAMNDQLNNYIKGIFPNSKSDLFAVFIERCNEFLNNGGYHAQINQHSWMFLSSYQSLRQKLLQDHTIISMLHLGAHAFEDINGEVVQSTSYIIRRVKLFNYKAKYYRLTDYSTADEKEKAFISKHGEYVSSQDSFSNITGHPISYWASEKLKKCFESKDTFGSAAPPKKGLDTNGESGKFFRKWFEVDFRKVWLNKSDSKDYYKWFEIDKGGGARKWYGNRLDIINYENNGFELKNKLKKANIRNEKLYFRDSLTYGVISTNSFSFRISSPNSLFDQGGPNCFPSKENRNYILALGNSVVVNSILETIAPTINFTVGDVAKVPVIYPDKNKIDKINQIVNENISLSKEDWDSSEISWDFISHPFVLTKTNSNLISDAYDEWAKITEYRNNKIIANEEAINEFFINLYGLENELKAKVSVNNTSIRRANREYDTKSFLSFFVGCVMGRYSLDTNGLIFAGGSWNQGHYKKMAPNKHGIILFTDNAYFENDIINRLYEFIAIIFGKESVDINLKWIAESLGLRRNETHEERVRRYFLEEFYLDHCKTYSGRPIYWLVDSGEHRGMRTLLYMHRYQSDTMATIRFEHLQAIQAKYLNEVSTIDKRLVNPSLSATEKRTLEKKKEDFQKRVEELTEFDKVLAEYANAQIEIDLDDGVKVNYEKFKGVLAKIK
ncbi:BREX-1 system adenine-specific DNA-methyltransferase PglX [Paenibacillus chartarius]|uniref:site-specific DNA-methyltransferase (adenine-specific) n=1 Tax=Paenibacillus chartarius TaxID=747481 RepID=A0ABV6DIF1_9BACL